MIISPEELKTYFCKIVKVNKKNVEQCKYSPAYELDQMIYAGIIGLAVTALSLILQIGYYIINHRIKNDFTKCFISSVFVPLSIASFCKIIHIIEGILYDDHTGWAMAIAPTMYTVALTAAFITSVIGVMCYLFMSMFIVCQRVPYSQEDSWSIFLTGQFLAWLMSAMYHFTAIEYRRLPLIFLIVFMICGLIIILIALLLSVMTLLLCNRAMKCNSQHPSVTDARTRLLFALFSVAILIPACVAIKFYYEDMMNRSPADFEYSQDVAVAVYFNYRILEFIAGPYMVLCILILHPYRTALLDLLKTKDDPDMLFHKTQSAPLINNAVVHPAVVVQPQVVQHVI